ncbi:MAG: hypothetical protein K5920_09480 [Bacteroidales bacterium]|nr:hypothetical protein [Bacteroidales bacterium]
MTANINTIGLSLLEEAFEKCNLEETFGKGKVLVVVCPAGAVEKVSSIIGSIKEGIAVVDLEKLKDVTSAAKTLAELISDYGQTPTSDDLEKMNELLRAKIQLDSFTDKEEARLSDIRRKKKDNEKWMKRNWKKK